MNPPEVVEYNLGDATITQAIFPEDSRCRNMRVRLNGIIAVPAGDVKPHPVVVILHGNHPGCPIPEGDMVDRWPCDPADEQANYRGFGYLAEHLAANGYVALSININAENTFGFGEPTPGERLKQIIDMQLRALATASAGGENKFGVDLKGKADMHRLAMAPCLTRAPADPALLERIRDYLAAFYGTPCDLLPPRALPAEAFHRERRQYRVERLAQTLLRALPEDALFLLAVTDRDLFIGDLTHVFGWASMRLRFGIVSTARVDVGRDRGVRLRRVLGLAAHECGHMLSMAHCVFYRCLMSGSNHLAESDARPLHLCPVCLRKLQHSVGFDPTARESHLLGLHPVIGPVVADVERAMDGNGRVVLRYSGTEPLARVMIEGSDADLVRSSAERLVEVIRREIGV